VRQVFETENNQIAVKGGKPGVCAAMVCDWIRRTGETGGVTTRRQLASDRTLAESQGKYMADRGEIKSMKGVIQRSGLVFVSLNTFGGADDAALPPYYVGECLTHAIASSRGFLLVEVLTRQGGHVIGLRLQPSHLEAFDPNVGLFALDNAAQVRRWWEVCLEGLRMDVFGPDTKISMVRLYSVTVSRPVKLTVR
jgi:hypothetical protein